MQLMANVGESAFGGSDPMAVGPRRIVSYELLMAAFKFSDPIQVFIQMKTDNFAGPTLKLSLCFHNYFLGRSSPL